MALRRIVEWLVVAAMLAACGSSTQPVGSATFSTDAETSLGAGDQTNEAQDSIASDDTSATAEPDVERADDEPSVNDAAISPLQNALGFDPDDQLELTNNFIRAAEELVRECMADRGFVYLPNDPSFAPSFERQLELEAAISDEQFVDQYGYGISTLFELNFQQDGVMAFVEQLVGPPPTEARSASEQEAYELALHGGNTQGLSAEELQQQAFAITNQPAALGSCRRTGYDTAPNPQGEIFNGLQSLLGTELAQLDERFNNDSRVRSAQRSWQACIAEQGYSYEGPDEIRDEITNRTNDIGGRFQQSPEALTIFAKAIEADLSEMDQQTRFDFLEGAGAFQGFAMVPALQVELDELIDIELSISRLSYDCTDRDLYRQVQLEVEQAFVEEHADQLALIRSGEASE